MAAKKERIISAAVNEPPAQLWSNCLRVGDVAYVSGMTSRGPDRESVLGDNEYEQAKVVFQKIKDMVEAAGGVMDDVVKMTIFVTRIGHNTEVWRARKEFFTGDFPACTLVEVRSLAKPEILLEIEAIAHIGCSANKD
ncbi:RidA family protein [Paraburkholderia saeva]|uniref:Aminoacrylate peracid reductase RutC n=1 Tax=Paraburkholderia saeva TaxID=2777537 RepID=A0A9N8RRP7_9BURK|nr:RidA family protein [Paraburkholderia saeva]CAG4886905.1 Putative aminoacrylate peracid reductase RutC [Paraburkholderia saeva]CAG4887084.1 Putative aminoacrylate peracid reductase RutC [Paraburkholderia saeva]